MSRSSNIKCHVIVTVCCLYVSLMDSEEVIREYQRTSRESESRLAMLSKENDELQSRVNELIKDKTVLSRELTRIKVGLKYLIISKTHSSLMLI